MSYLRIILTLTAGIVAGFVIGLTFAGKEASDSIGIFSEIGLTREVDRLDRALASDDQKVVSWVANEFNSFLGEEGYSLMPSSLYYYGFLCNAKVFRYLSEKGFKGQERYMEKAKMYSEKIDAINFKDEIELLQLLKRMDAKTTGSDQL